MLIYLDTNIVIYLIEQPPIWGPRAAARIAMIRANADQMVLSDLHRLECRVNALAAGDAARLAHFDAFFASSEVRVVPLSAVVCEQAAAIRATHGFRALDALHLAAAVVHGCDRFLTNDARLSGFPDIGVELKISGRPRDIDREGKPDWVDG